MTETIEGVVMIICASLIIVALHSFFKNE